MNEYNDIVEKMIETSGHFTQSVGVGRVLGQIFTYLYFNSEPQSLDNLTNALGISKGSASIGVRQLEQWDALEKVWVKGDRKDYYRAKDSLGRITKNMLRDIIGKRIESSLTLLDEAEQNINNHDNNEPELSAEDQFIGERVEKIRDFQNKASKMWGNVIIKKLLD